MSLARISAEKEHLHKIKIGHSLKYNTGMFIYYVYLELGVDKIWVLNVSREREILYCQEVLEHDKTRKFFLLPY